MLSNLSIRILHLLSSQNLNTFVLFSNSPKFEREEEVIDGRNNEKKTHGYLQTWNLSKILHRRIFWLKILHRQFHLISTVLVRKNTKNEWKWRNLHHWQKFYTAAGTDGMDKFHLSARGWFFHFWIGFKFHGVCRWNNNNKDWTLRFGSINLRPFNTLQISMGKLGGTANTTAPFSSTLSHPSPHIPF